MGRFIDYRPELSSPGNFFVGDGVLRLTDAASLTGGVTIDLDSGQQDTRDIGIMIRQSPAFFVLADLQHINAMDATYLNFATSYQLTDKYTTILGATYDATNGGFQSTSIEVHRKFASTLLGLSIAYNDINGQYGFGFVFQPNGATGEARVIGLGSWRPHGHLRRLLQVVTSSSAASVFTIQPPPAPPPPFGFSPPLALLNILRQGLLHLAQILGGSLGGSEPTPFPPSALVRTGGVAGAVPPASFFLACSSWLYAYMTIIAGGRAFSPALRERSSIEWTRPDLTSLVRSITTLSKTMIRARSPTPAPSWA